MQTKKLQIAIEFLFKPIARFCLKHTIKIQHILEIQKKTLIEAAEEDLKKRNEKITISKLSVMTGIHRRDVVRLYREGESKEGYLTLLGKVIGAWQLDQRFLNKSAKPRTLVFDGNESEFAELVYSVSNEIKPSTILFELERTKLVTVKDTKVSLVAEAFIAKKDIEQNFQLLSSDLHDLLAAVESNTFSDVEQRNLHAKTVFDNIDEESIPEIKEWILEKGAKYHEEVRQYLAKYDLDLNPQLKDCKSGGAKVVFGTFSFSEKGRENDK